MKSELLILPGLPYALHICGNTGLMLVNMLQTDADAIKLDYKTDISKIGDTVENTTTFIGNVDPGCILALGTVDKVQKKRLNYYLPISILTGLSSLPVVRCYPQHLRITSK